jgi:hypothetical protein
VADVVGKVGYVNGLSDVSMMRKEQVMKIEEQTSPVAHILEAVVETWAER